jgi:signal transduction histidine kinase
MASSGPLSQMGDRPFSFKLGAALLLCLSPMLIAVSIAAHSAWKASARIDHLVTWDERAETDAAAVAYWTLQCRRFEKDMFLNAGNSQVLADYEAKWSDSVSKVRHAARELVAHSTHQNTSALASRCAEAIQPYVDAVGAVLLQVRQDGLSAEEANALMTPRKEPVRALIELAEQARADVEEECKATQLEVLNQARRSAWWLLGSCGAAVGTCLVALAVLPRLLTIRLRRLADFARSQRAGDLTRRCDIAGRDEVGSVALAINEMLQHLNEAIEGERVAARARVEAEQLGEAKARFLANMSHEIRTPLTAILGFADLLLDQSLSPAERLTHIETVRRNGEHLLGVINDILDMSKIQAGEMPISSVRCSVCKIAAEVAASVRVRAIDKGVELNVKYEFPVPEQITTDPLRLRQILLNLVGNAVKFTETGEVRLTVRSDGLNAPVPYITLEVMDSGVGMTEGQLAQLFQPFKQVDDSAARRFGGTGLGLSIAKHLSGLLGAQLEARSTPGVGSVFTLRHPVGDLTGIRMVANAQEALADPEPPDKPAAPSTSLRGRVLLAEDGPDNQRLISFLLRKAGAQVDIAENGRIAINAIAAANAAGTPFDLILMDMQMPELDGYAATAELRASGYTGLIVALTAHAMQTDRERCLRAGCNDFATKPIERASFLALVKAYLEKTPHLAVATSSGEDPRD